MPGIIKVNFLDSELMFEQDFNTGSCPSGLTTSSTLLNCAAR